MSVVTFVRIFFSFAFSDNIDQWFSFPSFISSYKRKFSDFFLFAVFYFPFFFLVAFSLCHVLRVVACLTYENVLLHQACMQYMWISSQFLSVTLSRFHSAHIICKAERKRNEIPTKTNSLYQNLCDVEWTTNFAIKIEFIDFFPIARFRCVLPLSMRKMPPLNGKNLLSENVMMWNYLGKCVFFWALFFGFHQIHHLNAFKISNRRFSYEYYSLSRQSRFQCCLKWLYCNGREHLQTLRCHKHSVENLE